MEFEDNYTTGTQRISSAKIAPLKIRGVRGVMKRTHSMLSHRRQGTGNNPFIPLVLRGSFEEGAYSKGRDTDF